MNHSLRLLPLVLLMGWLPEGSAQFGEAARDLVKPTLVANTTAVAPGKPFSVLVRLEMKPRWHVYWQFGGDSGAPPTIEWMLPEGFTAGPIEWPIPVSHLDDGDLMTYIYEGELLLPVQITPPAKLNSNEINLKANLSWLVCEQICVPGKGEIDLSLPVAGDATPQPANEELFAKVQAQLPKKEPAPFKTVWKVTPQQYTIAVSGLPSESKLEFFPLPAGAGDTAKPKRPQVGASGPNGERSVTVQVEGGSADTQWQGLLVAQVGNGPRSGWMIASNGEPLTAPGTTPAPSKTGQASPGPGSSSGALGKLGLGGALWAALLGGLILNLMPCVLPVIALKIFSFVNQAGEHPERVFRLGLSFVAGVFVFFLGLAGLAIGLRAAGHGFFWGMQFADPRLMLALIAVVVVFALSMFGVFEITLGGAENTLGSLARKEGYGGAFVHGLFTTLLGTSCTAPFIGPVLGFAVTQSPLQIVLIFLVMAAGMSLPYFLLTWQPAWMRFLPKPGIWMERFKQLMGFVLLAVAVWLLGVFGEARGPSAAAAASWLMLLVALAGWIFGAAARKWWSAVLAIAVIALGLKVFLAPAMAKNAKGGESKAAANAQGIVWEPFSPGRVDAARKNGQAVFIDFTARWCANCIYNEGRVLNTAPVAAAFKQKHVLTLKADWTDFDPVISEWLKKFDRIGVPLYVLYRPGEDAPVVFPELLTQKLVLEALAPIAGK